MSKFVIEAALDFKGANADKFVSLYLQPKSEPI